MIGVTCCTLWNGQLGCAIQSWTDGQRLLTWGTLLAPVENVFLFQSPLTNSYYFFFQMYCLTWFSWSGEMQICISWVEKGETRNKLLLWCIYNLKPWMESSTLLRTQTYFSEWLARRRLWLWNLLYVWFKYWVWAHSPTLLSAPCITVTTKQSLSLQAALQLCPSERLKIFATGVRFRRCTGRGKGDLKKRSNDFFPESYISKCASNISYGECIQLSLTAF